MKIRRLISITLGVSFVWLLLAASILASPRPPQPPWPQPVLRIYGFDTAYRPVPWDDTALYEADATLAESWSGYALVRDGFSAAPVIVPVTDNSQRPNFAPGAGAIRFWISTSWSTANEKGGGSGPGHWARLLEQVSLSGKRPEVKWSLYVNETGDTIYLSGAGGGGALDLLKAPVQFAAGDWRLITLCYSPTETQLQIDNQIVANGAGLPPLAWWETNALGLVIGSDLAGAPDSLAGAQFEELTTLARWPQPSDWQELYYLSAKRRSLLGPLESKEEEQAKVTALKTAGWLPEDYGQTKLGGEGDGPILDESYAEGSLWLEITGVTNSLAYLIVHGTVTDVGYEILSKESLTNAEWVGEQTIIGADGQDWTPTTVAMGARTNELYFWARTLVDSDGDGLPDWWELEHGLDPNNPDTGGTGVSDGYKDGDNDGWTNLQEYQNGTSPSTFDAPPAPLNLRVRLDSTGTNVIVEWDAVFGAVVQLVLERRSANGSLTGNFQLSSSATNYLDIGAAVGTNGLLLGIEYSLRAQYAQGYSQTARQTLSPLTGTGALALTRGADGQLALVMPHPIPDLEAVELSSNDPDTGIHTLVVPASSFTGGVADLASWPTGFRVDQPVQMRVRLQSGKLGATSQNALEMFRDDALGGYKYGWLDGRQHLKENLRFLLRAGTTQLPFNNLVIYGPQDDASQYHVAVSTNYEHASFHGLDLLSTWAYPDQPWRALKSVVERPIRENRLWSNFLRGDYPYADTGWYSAYFSDFFQARELIDPPIELATTDLAAGQLEPALNGTNTQWLFVSYGIDDYLNQQGVIADATGTNLYLVPNTRNVWGLRITKGCAVTDFLGMTSPIQLLPGVWASIPPYPCSFFYEVEEPQFQSQGYYFADLTDYREDNRHHAPIPALPDFAPTNTTGLIIGAVGKPLLVGGWAKLAVTNGYADKFAYLGQYFEMALKMTNGIVTTNKTGILSPYGEFLPSEPGQTALVTMPDLDTGERGTATVYVVSMNLDVNHDGVMDLSFAGPDNTSPNKPFTFWVNNDFDGVSPLLSASDPGKDYEGYPSAVPNYAKPTINCQRDLEDFARIWICGMPALPNGYQVRLSMNSSSGNPAIKLFSAIETNGSIGYLTNSSIAIAQAGWPYTAGPGSPNWAIGEVTVSCTLTHPSSFFTNSSNNYFLFEGAGIGKGELVLTITQNSTNVIAQTSAWLDIQDVKDFYEQAVATNVTSGKPPSSLISDFSVIKTASTAPDETKQVIIFVHGINNTVSDYESTTRTIFKRLYWAGYHGRFASFRWPCAYLPPSTANPFQYNLGEFYAFKSATALKNYLSYLRNRPDLAGYAIDLYAHSQGNVVASEAVAQGATFDNYILTQGAIPAHCYDTNAPFLQKLLDAETNSVNATQTPFYPVIGGYHGYFAGLQGNLVDFYNSNDFALSTGTTLGLQTNWEEDQRAQKPEAFLGGPSYIYYPSNLTTVAYYTFGSSYTVTDLQEIKALVARSRSKAVGAQSGLHVAIDSSVDLFGSYGFGNTRDEHSAQFARPIQACLPYYQQMLTSFQILP